MLNIIIYTIVRLLSSTFRYREYQKENIEASEKKNGRSGYLLGIWHQQLFQGITAQTGREYVVIVSRSKDANAVAYTCRKLGHRVCRGSSRAKDGRDKGGKVAMEEMVDHLKQGIPGAVTVDGPKGPAREAKAGIFSMAQKAGVPIIPYVPIARRYWEFNSWDKFRLPKPFSIIDIYYGEGIIVDANATDFSPYQEKLKAELDRLSLLQETLKK